MPEYEGWKEGLPGATTKGWDIKYYKGLGTSTNDEAREYFANIDGNRKEFVWTGVSSTLGCWTLLYDHKLQNLHENFIYEISYLLIG